MKQLTNNSGLSKGDIIKVIEHAIMLDSETQTYPMHDFTLRFEIIRVNKKTYTCQYIEGCHTGGFGWTKDTDLTQYSDKKEYFF